MPRRRKAQNGERAFDLNQGSNNQSTTYKLITQSGRPRVWKKAQKRPRFALEGSQAPQRKRPNVFASTDHFRSGVFDLYQTARSTPFRNVVVICALEMIREDLMDDFLNCRHMELLCRRRAKADPQHRGKWLARAERWGNLGQHKISSRLRHTEQPDLGPMAMGPNTIDGDQRQRKYG